MMAEMKVCQSNGQPHLRVVHPAKQLTRLCRPNDCQNKQSPLIGQQLRVEELVREKGTFLSVDREIYPKGG